MEKINGLLVAAHLAFNGQRELGFCFRSAALLLKGTEPPGHHGLLRRPWVASGRRESTSFVLQECIHLINQLRLCWVCSKPSPWERPLCVQLKVLRPEREVVLTKPVSGSEPLPYTWLIGGPFLAPGVWAPLLRVDVEACWPLGFTLGGQGGDLRRTPQAERAKGTAY